MLDKYIQKDFVERFGASPHIFHAPGRINLIGEHTDYNDGFVLPAAVEFYTSVAISPRNDRRVIIYSEEYRETAEFSLEDSDPSPRHHWTDYIRGVDLQLRSAGYKIPGCNVLVQSNVPMGAGLSSSAALEVASALAFLHAASNFSRERTIDRIALPKLCQRAENETVGARCGIMDQFASTNGKAGYALLLDCRSLDFRLLPVPETVSMVICNTMVRHRNVSGEYNARRMQCEQGARFFAERLDGIRALRDVSEKQLTEFGDALPKTIFRRCRHVITENKRTNLAADALQSGQLDHFGQLMRESHLSLRDDFEVSCPELDAMVEAALQCPGIYGARMTGGGFGGCTINLVDKDACDDFAKCVSSLYEKKIGVHPQVYVTRAAEGAYSLAYQKP